VRGGVGEITNVTLRAFFCCLHPVVVSDLWLLEAVGVLAAVCNTLDPAQQNSHCVGFSYIDLVNGWMPLGAQLLVQPG
jgi:hypothetical protein